jgi:hypothetical protein
MKIFTNILSGPARSRPTTLQKVGKRNDKPQGYNCVLLLMHVLLQEFHRYLHLRLKKPVLGNWIRIRILPSSTKNNKKNLAFYYFVTSLWLYIYEEWCKCTNFMLLGLSDSVPDPLVRSTDPRIRIRIRIRTNMSRIPNKNTMFMLLWREKSRFT